MVGFLVVLLFPPTVGLVTYAILRLFWNRDVLATIGPPRRRKSNVFEGAKKRLRIMRRNIREGLSEWGRRRKSNSSGIFVGAEKRLQILRRHIAEGLGEWDWQQKSNIFVGAEKRLRIMRRTVAEGLSEWGRRRKFSSLGIFVRAEERFWIMRCNFARGLSGSSRDRAILLLVLGVIGGFVIGWYLPSY
jgi:hypothetical protein